MRVACAGGRAVWGGDKVEIEFHFGNIEVWGLQDTKREKSMKQVNICKAQGRRLLKDLRTISRWEVVQVMSVNLKFLGASVE